MRNTNYITANTIQNTMEELETDMHRMGLLKPEEQLRMQAASRTYGNSWWVAVTGGEFGTGVSTIDPLTAPSDWTARQFHSILTAYRAALQQVRHATLTGTFRTPVSAFED